MYPLPRVKVKADEVSVELSYAPLPTEAGTISAKRELSKSIGANAVSRLIELAPKVSDNGGYARIIRLGQRKSDGASMVFVEIILNS